MPVDILTRAHGASMHNQSKVQASGNCGCFYCLEVFPASQVHMFVPERRGEDTALCPKCEIDSVLPDAGEFPITGDFLQQMHDRWFSIARKLEIPG
jgi:hypothetical protein